MTAIRTRATLLIDKIEWPGLDGWVQSEMRFGLLLMREASEKGQQLKADQGKPLTGDQALAIDEPFHTWVEAFTSSLRRFRKVGPEAGALARLTEVATRHAQSIAAENGWPEPPDTIPGLSALDDDKR